MFRHNNEKDIDSRRFFLNSQTCIITIACFLISPVIMETCEFLDNCKCKYTNGSIIDLSSIASEDGARFKHMKGLNDSYFYYYNPCYNFELGSGDSACAKGVAVCQVTANGTQYEDCGDQIPAFLWDDKKGALVISYHSGDRKTNVTLICSHDASTPELNVIGEIKPDSQKYYMTLTTKCACPNGCVDTGLSFGSGLLIIFFISVLLYLFLGVVYNHLVRGAHGLELIPNYEFWKEFPLLVKDGCVYVSSGCRRETSYERI